MTAYKIEVIYEKSIGTKTNDLDVCLEVVSRSFNHCVTFAIKYLGTRLELAAQQSAVSR